MKTEKKLEEEKEREFYICPSCRFPVQFFKQKDRVFWRCPNCGIEPKKKIQIADEKGK